MRARAARLRKLSALQEKLWKVHLARVADAEARMRLLDAEMRRMNEVLELGGLSATLFPDLVWRRFERLREEKRAAAQDLDACVKAAQQQGRRFKALERLLGEAETALRETERAQQLKEITERLAAQVSAR